MALCLVWPRCSLSMWARRPGLGSGWLLMQRAWGHYGNHGGDDTFFFLCIAHSGKMAGASAVASRRRSPAGTSGNRRRLRRNGRADASGSLTGVVASACIAGSGTGQRVSDYDFDVVTRVRAGGVARGFGHVHNGESRRRLHALAGWRLIKSIGHAQSGAGRAAARRCGDVCVVSAGLEGGNGDGLKSRANPRFMRGRASPPGERDGPSDKAGRGDWAGELPSNRRGRV